MNFIGIDNGVTGAITIIAPDAVHVFRTPVKTEQSYTKAKQNITRVDYDKLLNILNIPNLENSFALIERPMVNPGMFKASISAIRSLECTLIAIESLQIPYAYIDSKEWQKMLLPSGLQGKPELKKASMDIGIRLYPQHADFIRKQKDADSLLIAEYCRRKYGK